MQRQGLVHLVTAGRTPLLGRQGWPRGRLARRPSNPQHPWILISGLWPPLPTRTETPLSPRQPVLARMPHCPHHLAEQRKVATPLHEHLAQATPLTFPTSFHTYRHAAPPPPSRRPTCLNMISATLCCPTLSCSLCSALSIASDPMFFTWGWRARTTMGVLNASAVRRRAYLQPSRWHPLASLPTIIFQSEERLHTRVPQSKESQQPSRGGKPRVTCNECSPTFSMMSNSSIFVVQHRSWSADCGGGCDEQCWPRQSERGARGRGCGGSFGSGAPLC